MKKKRSKSKNAAAKSTEPKNTQKKAAEKTANRAAWRTALQELDMVDTFESILIRIVFAVLAGTLLLAAVYMLPLEPIDRHVAASAPIFEAEGEYVSVYERFHSILDNRTDALMLLEAAHDGGGSVWERAMLVRHGWVEISNVATLIEHYCDGAPFQAEVPYGRYWHGYLVLLKPLLCVLDYGGIRVLNAVGQWGLLAGILLLLARKKRHDLIVPYLLTVLMLMPEVLSKNLEFTPCYYILSIGSIAVILARDRLRERPDALRRWVLLFAWIGVATPYFDFLTFPIATFGIPAVFWLSGQDEREPGVVFARLAALLGGWGVGYAGMWTGKWLIGSIIVRTSLFGEAAGSIAFRTAHESVGSALVVIGSNIAAFVSCPAAFAVPVYLAVLIALYVNGGGRVRFREGFRLALPYLLIALLPILWYLAAAEHSGGHWFFTCKALSVTAFSLLSMFAELSAKKGNAQKAK